MPHHIQNTPNERYIGVCLPITMYRDLHHQPCSPNSNVSTRSDRDCRTSIASEVSPLCATGVLTFVGGTPNYVLTTTTLNTPRQTLALLYSSTVLSKSDSEKNRG